MRGVLALSTCLACDALILGRGSKLTKTSADRREATGKKPNGADGSLLGAAALVAGNMVGGGILAIPTATSGLGMGGASAEILALWVANVATGLVLAEVACSSPETTTLQAMTERRLGSAWGSAVGIVFGGSNGLMMAAYATQGGEALKLLFGWAEDEMCRYVFATVVCAVLLGCSEKTIDRMNSAAVSLMGASFCALLVAWLPLCDFPPAPTSMSLDSALSAVPVLTSALVYQNCVPVVAHKLGGSLSKTRAAVLFGSAMPALGYVLFDASVLGRGPSNTGRDGLLDPLVGLSDEARMYSKLALAVFSVCAVSTSLVGTALSQIHEFDHDHRRSAKFATLAPPFLLAFYGPDNLFVLALALNGAVANPLLFGILPVILAIATDRSQAWRPQQSSPNDTVTWTFRAPFFSSPSDVKHDKRRHTQS